MKKKGKVKFNSNEEYQHTNMIEENFNDKDLLYHLLTISLPCVSYSEMIYDDEASEKS